MIRTILSALLILACVPIVYPQSTGKISDKVRHGEVYRNRKTTFTSPESYDNLIRKKNKTDLEKRRARYKKVVVQRLPKFNFDIFKTDDELIGFVAGKYYICDDSKGVYYVTEVEERLKEALEALEYEFLRKLFLYHREKALKRLQQCVSIMPPLKPTNPNNIAEARQYMEQCENFRTNFNTAYQSYKSAVRDMEIDFGRIGVMYLEYLYSTQYAPTINEWEKAGLVRINRSNRAKLPKAQEHTTKVSN